MSVFLIAQISIEDREEYAKYEEGFVEPFVKYGGRLLSGSEHPTILEGSWSCTRTVLIEFVDRAQAMQWYESPEYRAIIGHRLAASEGNVVLVDGYQPIRTVREDSQ